jgi:hypothetical protein
MPPPSKKNRSFEAFILLVIVGCEKKKNRSFEAFILLVIVGCGVAISYKSYAGVQRFS